MIPKKLQAELPFASKPKNKPARKRPDLDARRAVVMEPEERKAHAVVQHYKLMHKVKVMFLLSSMHKSWIVCSFVLSITMDFWTGDKNAGD